MDSNITIEAQCETCGLTKQLTVPKANHEAWQKGVLIQRALPMLSEDDREMLISQTCGKCWDEMFAFPEATNA